MDSLREYFKSYYFLFVSFIFSHIHSQNFGFLSFASFPVVFYHSKLISLSLQYLLFLNICWLSSCQILKDTQSVALTFPPRSHPKLTSLVTSLFFFFSLNSLQSSTYFWNWVYPNQMHFSRCIIYHSPSLKCDGSLYTAQMLVEFVFFFLITVSLLTQCFLNISH